MRDEKARRGPDSEASCRRLTFISKKVKSYGKVLTMGILLIELCFSSRILFSVSKLDWK